MGDGQTGDVLADLADTGFRVGPQNPQDVRWGSIQVTQSGDCAIRWSDCFYHPWSSVPNASASQRVAMESRREHTHVTPTPLEA